MDTPLTKDEQDLVSVWVDAGYKVFNNRSTLYVIGHEHAVCLLQKRIDDDKGKKYFIDIFPYTFNHSTGIKKSFQCALQFYQPLPNNNKDNYENEYKPIQRLSINVEFDAISPEFVEQKTDEIWTSLNCLYYEI